MLEFWKISEISSDANVSQIKIAGCPLASITNYLGKFFLISAFPVSLGYVDFSFSIIILMRSIGMEQCTWTWLRRNPHIQNLKFL